MHIRAANCPPSAGAVALMSDLTAEASPDIGLAERILTDLRRETRDGRGVTRMSYGPGEAAAHALVRKEAEALGLGVATDAALNLYISLPGRKRGPAVMVGSHLDSVPQGGDFDGAAGVLMGLSVIAGYRQSGFVPENDIVVMATRAEESTWFPASYIGSRAAFGILRGSELDEVRRAGDGMSLGAAISAAGGDPERLRAGTAQLEPDRIRAFIEPHIEQGPVLVEAGIPVGIATGIRGSFRHRSAVCQGSYAHSGATPRSARRDAVQAAAALVCALDELWIQSEAEGLDLSVTVGQFSTDIAQHAFSKVAGRAEFSLDFRSQSSGTLEFMRTRLEIIVAGIQRERRVNFDLGPPSGTEPAAMDARITELLEEACATVGVPSIRMACGAGHDAAVFARMGVPTGMILIRNEHGSHNPDEHMDLEDFAAAAQVLSRFCVAAGSAAACRGQHATE